MSGDGTKGLGWLSVGTDGTVQCVNTWEVTVFSTAGFKYLVFSSVGSVIGTADTVIDMLAEICGVCTSGVASFQAECITTYETNGRRKENEE